MVDLNAPSETRILAFKSTTKLRALLKTALGSGCLSSDELNLATKIVSSEDGEAVPYSLLKIAATKCRTAGVEGVWLHQALIGSDVFMPKPPPREKSEELKARLAKLQENLERKQYAEMVKDVTRHERKEKEREYMSTYKDQLGFGFHVIAIMFTGYMAGSYAFRHLFPHQAALHAAGGVIGLIVGMLVETILFIIQAARAEESREDKPFSAQKLTVQAESSANIIGSQSNVHTAGDHSMDTGQFRTQVRRRKIL